MSEEILKQILARLEQVDSRVSGLEGTMGSRLTELEEKMESRLSEVEEKVESRLAEVEGKMESHLAEVEEKMESRFSDIESNMAAKEDIRDIPAMKQAIFETLEQVKQLQSSVAHLARNQARQDRILESLAVRSLEQESEIRELRQAK